LTLFDIGSGGTCFPCLGCADYVRWRSKYVRTTFPNLYVDGFDLKCHLRSDICGREHSFALLKRNVTHHGERTGENGPTQNMPISLPGTCHWWSKRKCLLSEFGTSIILCQVHSTDRFRSDACLPLFTSWLFHLASLPGCFSGHDHYHSGHHPHSTKWEFTTTYLNASKGFHQSSLCIMTIAPFV
jgi:hypothetical protein